MVAKGASTRLNPVRLQSIPHLRVRSTSQRKPHSCEAVMSSMLNCWASAGYTAEGCIAIEHQLRACMDGQKPQVNKKNTVNYHLSRMYPKVVGPKKKSGVLG